MSAIVSRLRAELRTRWRSWAVLAVLIGVFGGAVLAVAAGARRTATAFPRLLEASRAGDVLVSPVKSGLEGYYRDLEALPQVESLTVAAGVPLVPLTASGEPDEAVNALASVDGRLGRSIDRPQLIDGRLPRPDAPDETLVDVLLADRYRLRVGSRLPSVAAQFDPEDPEGEPQAIVPVELTVVGVARFINEVVPTARNDTEPRLLLTPAAYRAYAEGRPLNFDGAFVRLGRGPADLPAFVAAAEELAREHADEVGGQVLFGDQSDRNRRVQRALRPQAVALGLFAAFAGLAVFLVLGQALSRQVAEDATEAPILRTLGLTRTQLMGLALVRTAAIASAGAVLAVAIAGAVSPRFPIGVARRAEPHPGFSADWTVLGLGAVVIIVLLVARAASPAWRSTSAPAGAQGAAAVRAPSGPSIVTRLAGSTALPPTATTGMRMALETGQGRTAVPVRTTLVGAVLGVAAVAATITFGVNLARVVTTPQLYGRDWDLAVDSGFGSIDRAQADRLLSTTPVVVAWSGGFYGEGMVAGRAVTALGIEGDVHPTIVQGRPPRADDEAVLGTSTLRHARRSVGDRVEVTLNGEARPMRIVGRAVFPALGRGEFPQTGLGEGVLTTAGVLTPPPELSPSGEPAFNFYLVDLRGGAGRADETVVASAFREGVCPADNPCYAFGRGSTGQRPAEIDNLERIQSTPIILAAVLSLLALATVGHTLVTSVRRRRRDLAVLKTIGFVRGQVSLAVAWQATTFAALAALVGLPLGVFLGRVMWRALAGELGIVPDPVTPTLALVVAVPAAVVLANLMALLPGWMAGRVRPSVALRSE